MAHLRDVHHHLDQTARSHRQAHEDALREAAIARAQLEAASGSQPELEPSGEDQDGG